MKKIIFMFAILFGTMLASCNNEHSEAGTKTVDSVEVVADSVSCNCDTCQCDTCFCE